MIRVKARKDSRQPRLRGFVDERSSILSIGLGAVESLPGKKKRPREVVPTTLT